MEFTQQQLFNACENMQRYGGSFASNLGKAMHHADSINRAKIIATWPELIDEYKSMHVKKL